MPGILNSQFNLIAPGVIDGQVAVVLADRQARRANALAQGAESSRVGQLYHKGAQASGIGGAAWAIGALPGV